MLQSFDPRNEHILIHVGGRLLPREEARVSVFDSAVQGGDAVWEGLRVYPKGILSLSAHLRRLRASAHALAFVDIPEEAQIRAAIRETLAANGMTHDTHIRLTLTRGEKITSGMDPRLNTRGACLIVLAEWKPPVYDNHSGIRVITSSIRRNIPAYLDSRIHHNNLLNNILAKIQANVAGVDAAVMLDDRGFVAELNDTNLFLLRDGVLLTPHADACLPGITRGLVLRLAGEAGMPVVETNLTLTDFYNADGVFATGTMGELTPIVAIDGRQIGSEGLLFRRIQEIYRDAIPGLCEQV
jgi:branched-chain amino acid aminotransferase